MRGNLRSFSVAGMCVVLFFQAHGDVQECGTTKEDQPYDPQLPPLLHCYPTKQQALFDAANDGVVWECDSCGTSGPCLQSVKFPPTGGPFVKVYKEELPGGGFQWCAWLEGWPDGLTYTSTCEPCP